MSLITEKTGNKFIVIIDEWDVLIRDEAMNQKIQDEYIGYTEEVRELCDLWSWLY